MATYLIGDIQGCLEPLERLLEAINFDPAADQLWPCGDLVNRGGDSLGVLRLLYSVAPCVETVLGNHDLHLLAEQARHPEGGSNNDEFEAILQAHDQEDLLAWLNQMPLAAWDEQRSLLRVHAGVVPSWTWQQTLSYAQEVSTVLQGPRRKRLLRKIYGDRPRRWRPGRTGWRRLRLITNVLCRIRYCDAQDRLYLHRDPPRGKQRKRYQPWFKHPNRATRDVRVAFGHWAALGLRCRKRYLALDSGCVWGGQLSAWCLEEERLIQINARR